MATTPEEQLEAIKAAVRALDIVVRALEERLAEENALVGNDYADAVDHLKQVHYHLADIKGQLGAVSQSLKSPPV